MNRIFTLESILLGILAGVIGVYAHFMWGPTLGSQAGWIGVGAGIVVAAVIGHVHSRSATPRAAVVLLIAAPIVGALAGQLHFREQWGPYPGWAGLFGGAAAALLVLAVTGRVVESRAGKRADAGYYP